MIMGSCEM